MRQPRAIGTAFAATALLLLAGCIDAVDRGSQTTAVIPTSEDGAPVIGQADWTGHVIASETDVLMHVSPTEGVLWPHEQAGVVIEIPDGASAIEVAVAWEGNGRFGIHLHSYNKSGEYVGHRSTGEQWSENPHCIRVPANDVAPGHWMVMIHSRDALQADFTMSVLTEGAEPMMMNDTRHGHDVAREWMEGREREEHQPETCTMWAPIAEGANAATRGLRALKLPGARLAEG